MSLFLGPIHHWLYRKIRLQEELITTLAEQEGAKSGDSGKYENFVNRELRPLEELIDTDNIHGWLQARIHDAEGRYAALVSAILKEDSGALPRIKEEVFAFGASNAVEADASPAEAYRHALRPCGPSDRAGGGSYFLDPRSGFARRVLDRSGTESGALL